MNPVEHPESVQRTFYHSVLDRALAAQARTGLLTRTIAIAGVRVRLLFAGEQLLNEFMGAIAHLQCDDDEKVDANFHIWDSETSGVPMAPPPVPSTSFTDRGDLWGFGSRRYRSAFHWSEYSVCVFDTDTQVGVYWVERVSNLPYWARSSPMRTLFHWLLEGHGRQLVHAAAVGTDTGALLIVGKGGVGKSTSSLACLSADLRFLGDDYVVVGFDPHPMVWSLYCTAKVTPRQLTEFPELAPLADELSPGDEKAVIRLYPNHASKFARAMVLRWMLTPRFGDAPGTRFEAVSPIALHQAAAFTTLSQLPQAGPETHGVIGRMVASLPRARIVLGHDLRALPTAIAHLIEQGADVAQEEYQAQPLISVIIPVFNGARFLPEAIATIVAQHYPALEIIIVDDGSTDDLEKAVAALTIDVRFFRQMNAGPAAARNRGLRDASGEYIAFLDVDDLWPDGTLIAMLSALRSAPDAEVVIGRAQMARVDANGQTEPYDEPDGPYPYYIGSALYRRTVFDQLGGFDDGLRFGEDTDWFQRLKERGPHRLHRFERTTLIVRRHGANMTDGKTVVELGMVQALKRALDRRRAQVLN